VSVLRVGALKLKAQLYCGDEPAIGPGKADLLDRLVETTAGGGKARGARLTDTGRAVLSAYRSLESRLADAAGETLGTLDAMLRAEPLPPAQAPLSD
jgi:molybdate transport system regulatory protein